MSLPPAFSSPQDYFEEILKFLQKYQIFFKFPNTKILSNKVLKHISVGEFENVDVFDEKFKLESQNGQIDDFTRQIEKLKVEYCHQNVLEDQNMQAPLGAKKKHEILYLAKEIKDLCETIQCDTVVDFGSGLGYLDQLIFDTCKYNVLGLECNTKHYVGAKTRQKKYHENSKKQVKYVKHTINDDSSIFIRNYVAEKFGLRPFCIAGLHVCADLTINSMNLFLNIDDAKAIVIMPCCYHRMVQNGDRFVNFPLSKTFSKIFEKIKAKDYLQVPFLRLAAQPARPTDSLKDLVFSLLARATLEYYADIHNCTLTRNKRKAVNVRNANHDFEIYAENATSGFKLSCKNQCNEDKDACKCNLKIDSRELNNILWNRISTNLIKKQAAIFVLYQRLLQPLCENLILYDRIVYLKEKGVHSCKVKKIVDECISPRSLAIVACK